MDAVAVELLLWAGLIFFLWVLKDTMGKLESDIEHSRHVAKPSSGVDRARASSPVETLFDPIGRYRDMTIHRYAIIAGRKYEFAYICPSCTDFPRTPGVHCLEPGLVYREIRDEAGPRRESGSA